jgi:hypothetical protein
MRANARTSSLQGSDDWLDNDERSDIHCRRTIISSQLTSNPMRSVREILRLFILCDILSIGYCEMICNSIMYPALKMPNCPYLIEVR